MRTFDFPPESKDKCMLVLDANILIRDFWWKSSIVQYLQQWLFLDHTLVIPEIAILEASACIKRRATDLLNRMKRGFSERLAEQYKRLFNRKSITKETPDELAHRYEQFLRKLIRSNKGIAAPIPDIDIKEILSRSVLRKKPFNNGDKGFRDTILWLNVIGIAQEYKRVSFVSENINDFGNQHRELHQELAEEVSLHLPKGMSFFYFDNLNKFVEFFDKDDKARIDIFQRSIQTNKIKKFDLFDWIYSNLPKELDGRDFDEAKWVGLPRSIEAPILTEMELVTGIDVSHVKFLDQNRFIRFFCDTSIVGFFSCCSYFNSWKYDLNPNQIFGHQKYKKPPFLDSVDVRLSATFSLLLIFDLKTSRIVFCEGSTIPHLTEAAHKSLEEIEEISQDDISNLVQSP